METLGLSEEKIRLIKPNEATGEVKKIYDQILQNRGKRWLVPSWGFFAHVPKLLRLHYELVRALTIEPGVVPRPLMNAISLVCALAVGCLR